MHSMEPRELRLALEVLTRAWARVRQDFDRSPSAERRRSILAAVRAEADDLPKRYQDVSVGFAEHAGGAAVWYLDRATRRLGDPDRDGYTPAQRAVNLAHFAASAAPSEVERLFAVAVALNADDA